MEEPETFDADYVKQLRSEAAKYRSKAKDLESELAQRRDLEGQIQTVRVENELVRRGITADPNWVKVEDASDITGAVDGFLEKYPQFSTTQEPQPRHVEGAPQSLPPEPNKANVPGPSPQGAFGGRNVDEIRKDPKARSQMTNHYRTLLGNPED